MGKYKSHIIGNRKIAIIGVGFVGASIAYALTLNNIGREIVLIDKDKEKANGEAQDIRNGIPGMGKVDVYAGDYSDCADCDLIIITAGRNRRTGESRLNMANENVKIVKNVIESVKKYYTRGVVLVISNPVDILTYKVDEWMRLSNGLVLGTGCILDTSRFIRSIADYLEISPGVIGGYLVGEHGDSQVPVWSRVTVGGIPIEEYCENISIRWDNDIKKIITERTKIMGADIISAKGRTHYGIATCVCYLADAIINQRPIIAPVTSTLCGEHGVRDVAISVPSVIGPCGVQQRIRERWTPEEYRGFFDSVDRIREVLEQLQ